MARLPLPSALIPLTLPLLLALALEGCADPGIDLLVELQTDLEPGVEFTSVRTVLDDGSIQERSVFVGDELMSPTRIAEFRGLLPGERSLRVTLLDGDGSVIAERPVMLLHDADYGLQVRIMRDCVDGPDIGCDEDTPPVVDDETVPDVVLPAPDVIINESYVPPGRCLSQLRLPLSRIDGMLTLADGTLVVHGRFYDEVTIGDTTHVNVDGGDALVAALDPDGNVLWSVSFTSDSHSWVRDAVAVEDALYLAGYFSGTMGIGTSTFTADRDDAFVARIDAATGTPELIRTFGGPDGDQATAISHHEGSIYVGGWFTGPAEFMGVTQTSEDQDAFVLRLAPRLLTRMSMWTIGGNHNDTLHVLDATTGDIFVGGNFRENLDVLTEPLRTRELDAFVGKADVGGGFRWAERVDDSTGIDYVEGVATAHDTVVFSGTRANVLADGQSFVRAYRSDGMLLWERRHGEFAGEFYERNQGGNVVIAEDTVYSVSTNTLPLDIDGLMVTGAAGRDVLITARDLQTGTLRWHRVLGSDADLLVPRMTVGRSGDLWVSAIVPGELTCDGITSSDEDGRVTIIRVER